jgi:microsomal epoxide hydrolase
MEAYAALPASAKGPIEPFKIHIPQQKLQDLKTLLRLSPIVQDTYENQAARAAEGHEFGVSRAWLGDAKRVWEEEFDW